MTRIPGLRPEHRLLPAAPLAWTAALVLVGVPSAAGPAAAVLVVAATGVLAGAVGRRRRPPIALVLALAGAGLVAGSIALQAPVRDAPELTEARGPADLIVAVSGHPAGSGLPAVVLAVDGVGLDGASPVLVFLPDGPHGHPIGATIGVTGDVVPTEPGDPVAFLVLPVLQRARSGSRRGRSRWPRRCAAGSGRRPRHCRIPVEASSRVSRSATPPTWIQVSTPTC